MRMRLDLPGCVDPLFNAIDGPQNLRPDSDSLRYPGAGSESIIFTTVGRICLHLPRKRIQSVNPARRDNSHIMVGLADANEINKPHVIGAASQLEQRSNRPRLRLRFALSSNFRGTELDPYTASRLAFYSIMCNLISLKIGF